MRDILEMLAGGGFVSGEKISAELGISRAAVWKRVEALRAQGYAIESAGRRGYRLVPGDALDPSLWKGALTTRELGRGEVRYQAEVSSTNTVLKEMAVGGAPQGSLCLCDRQTAGRGRLGRQWISPAGQGLWCSTLLRPRLKPEDAPFITFCTAMALAEAIDRLCGTQARIKWPNDVVIQGKKCCGILLEMAADPDRLEYVVVGTGVNLQPGAYPPGAQGSCHFPGGTHGSSPPAPGDALCLSGCAGASGGYPGSLRLSRASPCLYGAQLYPGQPGAGQRRHGADRPGGKPGRQRCADGPGRCRGTAPGAVRRCFRAGDHGLCVRDWGWICAEFPAWRHF